MSGHRTNSYPDYSDQNRSLYLQNDYVKHEILNKIESAEEKLLRRSLYESLSNFNAYSDNSIYTGYSGVALLAFRKYLQNQDPKLLSDAIKLVDSAVLAAKKKRISFLNGDAGPLALAAVLHKYNNEDQLSQDLISRLLRLDFGRSSHPDEVLYGRAGYLYSLLFVDKYCDNAIPGFHYRKVIESILQSGRQLAKIHKTKTPLYYMWHDKNYLGAAHGLAGILYLLLAKKDLLSEKELVYYVKPTLDWLCEEKFPSNNPRSSEGSDRDRLVQWCHGAPGFVHLYLSAYQVFQDRKYLKLAEDQGEVVWERGILNKGYSICHGVSGNAYTFLALYKATMDEKHLYRAVCFADYCTSHPKREGLEPDRPYSLFEGIAGISYFLIDIKDPLNSSFPAYEI